VPGQIQGLQQARSEAEHQRAERELKQEEKQRMFHMIPAFNVSNIANAAKLSPKQKTDLAFKNAIDPYTFAFAGIDAGISQAQDGFHGYGQGMEGYAKRFAASYADSFDGNMLGGAVFPILLRQDPRYFPKGSGTFTSRLLYAVGSIVRCKGDNGQWQPNFSYLMGNLAAGGISNAYYPASDRGVGLTFQRAMVVTAEGGIGAVLFEFWPDISRKLNRKHQSSPDSH